MSRRKRMLKGLEEDIRDHLERETQDNIDRGMSTEDAHYAALRKFGNVMRVKEDTRAVWSVVWLEQLLQDIRFGIRALWRSPGLTMAAVLAIALGIGINVGVFSVLNGVALRLLPVPQAKQLVNISQIFHGRFSRNIHGEGSMFSYPEYLDYRDHNHVFSGLAAYEPYVEATLAGGNAEQLLGASITCNYFDVLNEHPAQGRGLVDADCAAPGANAVVVLSDNLWRRSFGGDPSLVGKTIRLNHTAFTVVGIAPAGFTGTEAIPSAFWAPITMESALEPGRLRLAESNQSWLALLGRTRPQVTIDEVRADLLLITGRIDRQYPGRRTTLAVRTATFFNSPEERGFVMSVASVTLGAFGLVLLIACANVANLLLARASVRQKEIALRLSIGAGRWRLVRQLLTESLLLSFGGGVLGSVIALWSFVKLTQFVTSHLPRGFSEFTLNVAPNLNVLAYSLGLTLVTGIAFGLIPAWQSARLDLNTILKGDGAHAGTGRRSGRWLLDTLVGSQVAVCMVLLLTAGLLLRGLYYAQTVDPGFDDQNVAQTFLNLRSQGYDAHRASVFMRQLRERVAEFPGVVEVARAECAPLSHDFSEDEFTIPGRAEKIGIEYNHVSPEYFSTVGIPIVRGRGFTTGEKRDAASVIVTEATARKLWPDQDPLGKTLREDTGRQYSVIGVAKNAQVSHLGDAKTTYIYFPAGPEDDSRTYLLVRYANGFEGVATVIRNISHSLDRDVSVNVIRLADNLEIWQAPSRIAAALSTALGALALLLASIGVYGMVSYSLSRSVREIGIRMALGANGARVMSLVLWQAMRPVLMGGLAGIALCAGVSKVFASLLFGLSTHDLTAFVCAPLFLVGVGLIASYIPARRALRVDPMIALRCE